MEPESGLSAGVGCGEGGETPCDRGKRIRGISLNLRILHVLSEPEEDWDGYTGFFTEDLLQRELPEDPENFDYYLCGPEPMMDLVERELAQTPIPLRQISSERFQIV